MIQKSKIVVSKLLMFVALFGFLFSFDIYTKILAEKYLLKDMADYQEGDKIVHLFPENKDFLKRTVSLFNGYFDLDYTRNFDIGFSLFNNLNILTHLSKDSLSRVVLVIQSLSLLILIIFFLRHDFDHYLAFVFIIAGGFGNVIDRFINGYVIDFLSIKLLFFDNILYWPIFNVADIFVTIGAILFFLDIVFFDKKKKDKIQIELIESQ